MATANDASPTTHRWTDVYDADELWEDDMAGVTVRDTPVLLLNSGGDLRAYHNRCPHQAWPLEDGDFTDGVLTCSNHLWEFDARSGRGINPDDCALTAYPVKVENGRIWVAVP
ncbi:MAG: Rieske 2Fe-2S domain-containing protein [Pseudonocardia sp.]